MFFFLAWCGSCSVTMLLNAGVYSLNLEIMELLSCISEVNNKRKLLFVQLLDC